MQSLLTTVAVSDAAHVFDKTSPISTQYINELINGIPSSTSYTKINDRHIISHIVAIDSEGNSEPLNIDSILDVETAFNALGNEYTLQFSSLISRSYIISSLMVDGKDIDFTNTTASDN